MFRRHRPDLSSLIAEHLADAQSAGDLGEMLTNNLARAPLPAAQQEVYDLEQAVLLSPPTDRMSVRSARPVRRSGPGSTGPGR